MKPANQRSIASFFTKAPSAAANASKKGDASADTQKPAELTDKTIKQPTKDVAADAPKPKRLKRAIQDSPETKAEPQAMEGLEDDIEVPSPAKKPASPRKRSPTKTATPEAKPLTTSTTATEVSQPAAEAPQAMTTDEPTASSPSKSAAKASDKPANAEVPPPPVPADAPKAAAKKRKSSPTKATAGKAKPATPAAAAAADGATGSGDEISFTASGSGSGSGDEAGPEATSRVKRLKRSDDTSAPSRKKTTNAGKMEGVGAGALKEAQNAAAANIKALCTWKAGEPVPYAFLADTLEMIANESKRLQMQGILTNCFRAIIDTSPDDLLPAVYMCVNRIAPEYTNVELGVGDALLIKALADNTGRSEAALKKDYQEEGDLGSLAVKAKGKQKQMFAPKPLTVRGVFSAFRDISKTTGDKSQERKRATINKLLANSKGNEAGYLMRSLQGKLRIGLAEQSVLAALAHAVVLHQQGTKMDTGRLANMMEEALQAVKAAFSECPSYDELVPALIKFPVMEVDQHVHFKTSIPIKPMLAKPTTGVSEVLDKFTGREFTCEYKYDGERAQIHVMNGGKDVMIFSRNSENMTGKYPDLAGRMKALLQPGIDSVVLDGEAVGWDPVAKKILPFQTLSTRARKDVKVGDIKVQAIVFAFDCLFLNGKSLLKEPLTKRREALYSAIKEKEDELKFAINKTSTDLEELQNFLNDAVSDATEGLIVKTLIDTYEPSKRSSHWLKLKKDYMEGVGDTFDVVPIGAFHGKGKRTGVYGAYLLAVWDPQSETYQTISKLGTGFSDEQLKELSDSLNPHAISAPRKYYAWDSGLEPDVWFDPVKVWEVKAADLSISPVHKAGQGLVDDSKGISIRFPRLIRVRDDKGPEDATTAAQVAEMYRQQAVVKAKNQKAEDDE